MAVPDYQSFMRPLMLLSADGEEHSIRDAINELADQFRLSGEERSEVLPSGLGTVLANRVSWAKTYLLKAGALEKTRRAHFRITARGRELLRDFPAGINSQTLRSFPEFRAFQEPSGGVLRSNLRFTNLIWPIPTRRLRIRSRGLKAKSYERCKKTFFRE